MSANDTKSVGGAQLNTMEKANEAKGKSRQKHTNVFLRSFSRCPKSRFYVVAAISFGVIFTFIMTVLITTIGFQSNEKLQNGPCDDFYKFSCQLWNEQHPRPEWKNEWNVFSDLSKKFDDVVVEILENHFQHGDIDGLLQAKELYGKCLGYYGDGSNHTRKAENTLGLPFALETDEVKEKNLPINELCAQLVTDRFKPVIIHEYIARKYPNLDQFEKIRAEVQQMFDNIKMVFQNADSPFFSKFANNTNVCISFPDWILNSTKVQSKYEGFQLQGNDSFEIQFIKAGMWRRIRDLMDFIKSSNSAECWKLHTQIAHEPESTHTAISMLNNNVTLIYIPLGILQPPIFQLQRSKAMNYGSLGNVIGHELAHAYLGVGWTKSTDEGLASLIGCLKRQYSIFTSDDSVPLNTEITLQENLADNLGLLASFIAYSKLNGMQDDTDITTNLEALGDNDTQHFELPGNQTNQLLLSQLSDDQMFFLSFSRTWCESNSKKHMETKMKEHIHAPGMFRVLGTLENSEEFAKSWNCSTQSENRQKSCQSFLAKSLENSI